MTNTAEPNNFLGTSPQTKPEGAALPLQPAPAAPSRAPVPSVQPPSALNLPQARTRREGNDVHRLIVGREISLSGAISACDQLIVEGTVEANLTDSHDLQIAETGLFKGSASVDEADIRGRFEGTLAARRLIIRATAKVSGTVRYGELQIERGGQISGEVVAAAAESGAD
jgi:cytoskeletal protein CcmA (bactofilin family)